MPVFPIDLGTSLGWEDQAACRGRDASLFFGPNRFEPKRERLAREAAAKEICSSCPVSSECRDHAMEVGEAYGVWGGLGEAERRNLVEDGKKRRVKKAG